MLSPRIWWGRRSRRNLTLLRNLPPPWCRATQDFLPTLDASVKGESVHPLRNQSCIQANEDTKTVPGKRHSPIQVIILTMWQQISNFQVVHLLTECGLYYIQGNYIGWLFCVEFMQLLFHWFTFNQYRCLGIAATVCNLFLFLHTQNSCT